MAKYATIHKGRTSYTAYISVDDSSSTTGGKLTGLVYNTSNLVAYYVRQGGSSTAITLATLSAANSAWSSGGFKEVDATNMPGVYRLDIPDAVLASGADNAVVVLKGATNMAPVHFEVELMGVDLQDSVRAGITALPNVASGSAGAIPTTGTGSNQINVSGGRADANLAYWNGSAVASPDATGYPKVTVKSGTGTGEINLSSGKADANVVTFAAATGLSPTRANTAQAGAAGSITLDASASSATDFYKGSDIVITGGTGSGQTRMCTAYNGSTKVATVAPNWVTNPDNTSTFAVLTGASAVDVEAWGGSAIPTSDTAGYPKVTVKSGTGTGELNLSSGATDANVTKFGGSAGTFASGIPQASLSTTEKNNIGSAVWDTATSSHVTPGSFGGQLQSPESGTAQAGASTSITLRSGASSVTDFYKNSAVFILSGTGAGQFRFITAYNGSTKVATVGTWATNPDATSVYTIEPFDAIPGASAPTATQNADAVWNALLSTYTSAGSMGERMNGFTVRRGTAQSGTTSSVTLDASASATNDLYKYNFVTILSGTGAGQSRQITGYTGSSKAANVAPNFTVAPDNTSVFIVTPFGLDAATVALIAAAVWDETRAAHTTSGTMGEYARADALRVNGDATAAANAASAFNGTGYNFPNSSLPLVTAAGSVTGNVGGNVTGSVGSLAAQAKTDVANATWDATRAGHTTSGTMGEGVASVQGNVTGSVASVTGAVGSVTGAVGGAVASVTAAVTVGTNNDKTGYRMSSTGVNDILDGALTEPSGVFSWASATLRNVLAYIGAKASNRTTETATLQVLRNRANSADIASATVSDDGTTAVKGSDT